MGHPARIPGERAVPLTLPTYSWALRVLALLEAMRPKQWFKNVFVLAGLVFGGQLFVPASCARALACFFVFCAASSAVYLVNDVFDRRSDAHHPIKRLRPVASGRLPVVTAVCAAAVLGVAAIAGSFALSRSTFLVLALYLALGKRRNELTLLRESAAQHRKNLGSYSVPLLDSWLTALSGATIVCYALYTQSPRTVEYFHTTNLLYTVPFVVYALFRYQHLVVRNDAGGDPGSSLLGDRGMMTAILAWAAVAAIIIYWR